MTASVWSVVFSALAAAFAAIFVTRSIERLGGTLGGVLGSAPTTIVPFSIGLASQLHRAAIDAATNDNTAGGGDAAAVDLRKGLYTVPVGMFLDVGFLLIWRELPRTNFFRSMRTAPMKQLITMITVSVSFWIIAASIVILLLRSLLADESISVRSIGAGFIFLSFLLGLCALLGRYVPAPAGRNQVTWRMIAARGVLAGSAIGVAVLLSQISPFAAGLASAFPAIFLTTMVALWTSQGGAAVPGGATGPMMLGSLSVSAYAICFAEVHPVITARIDNFIGATAVTVLICWPLAVCTVSFPVYALLKWRKEKAEAEMREQELELGEEEEEEADPEIELEVAGHEANLDLDGAISTSNVSLRSTSAAETATQKPQVGEDDSDMQISAMLIAGEELDSSDASQLQDVTTVSTSPPVFEDQTSSKPAPLLER